jgi:hypothetical protein
LSLAQKPGGLGASLNSVVKAIEVSACQHYHLRRRGLSLKGRQKVADGRSVAQTTGPQSKIISHPERVSEKEWYTYRVRTTAALLSGGLRYAETTGYFLTALRAEIRSLRFI